MRRRTPWWLVLLVVIAGASVGAYAGTYLVKVRQNMIATGTGVTEIFTPAFGGRRYARVLMIGVDNTGTKNIEDNSGLSDTLVVFAIDTKSKEIRGISIPRDTRVEIPGYKTGKINSAHALGGPDLSVEAVSRLLNCPIEYYVKTTVPGLVKLVDMVGGVYIIVDKNMRYTDRRGGLYINLKGSPEKQLLDGTQAMGYVRFRHDAAGDYGYKMVDGKKVPMGRVVRQQYFFRALANRILAMPHKSERMEFLTKALNRKYILSNLTTNDWRGLMDAAKDFDPETIVMDVLPSTPTNIKGVSYVQPDTVAIPEMVSKNLLFEDLNDDSGKPTLSREPVTIQVLNGSGRAGLAKSVADALKRSGYTVIEVGNAPSRIDEACAFVGKKTEYTQVKTLSQVFRCSEIVTQTQVSGKADLTIILGKKFDNKVLNALPSAGY